MESKIITTIEEVQSYLLVQMTSHFDVIDPLANLMTMYILEEAEDVF